MKFPAEMSLGEKKKSRAKEKSAGAALLWLQHRIGGSPFYVFTHYIISDLPFAETDWFVCTDPSDVMDTPPCFIVWNETFVRVIEEDRLPMISLYVIASIIIYICLSFLFLRNQMETLKVWARLKGTEGTGRAVRGRGLGDEAACWAQGWRACKRS